MVRMALIAVALFFAALAACTGDRGGATGEAATKYEVVVRFNTSVSHGKLEEAESVLRLYSNDLKFLVQESFPPTGRATLSTADPNFCADVEAKLEAKPYIDVVTCSQFEPAANSGIQGQVLLGPTCPVVREGSPCPDRPYQATIAIWNVDRVRKIHTFTTDEQGRLRIPIKAGVYYLDPQPTDSRPFPSPRPQTVTVLPGQFISVTIQYDTGIR